MNISVVSINVSAYNQIALLTDRSAMLTVISPSFINKSAMISFKLNDNFAN